MKTLLWYDLETFGTNSKYDRIAQFAAIRTDMDFNAVSKPIVLYSKLTPDYLPNPESCKITHITPQFANRNGLIEEEFIKRIRNEMLVEDTITLGYNSVAFDDEFIRNTLYRNLYDPYEREYMNGCSRYDIIDLVRATRDLRSDGIVFDIKNPETGRTSFKLTDLTKENNIEHIDAHDALSDVRATISVAKLIREKQRQLWDFALEHRGKIKIASLIDEKKHTPFLYTSSKFSSERGNTHPMMPLFYNKERPTELYAFDLLKEAPEEMDLYDYEKSGIVKISINRCPFIAPIKVLTKESERRLGFSKEEIISKRDEILKKNPFDYYSLKVQALEEKQDSNKSDVDLKIYSSFITKRDKATLERIRAMSPKEKLNTKEFLFDNDSYHALLWRQVCRNHPESLEKEELDKWKNFCSKRLLIPITEDGYSIDRYMRKLDELIDSVDTTAEDKITFIELKKYGKALKDKVLS